MKKLILGLIIAVLIAPAITSAATCTIRNNTMRNGKIKCVVEESYSQETNVVSKNWFEQMIWSFVSTGGNIIKGGGDVSGGTIVTGNASSIMRSIINLGSVTVNN